MKKITSKIYIALVFIFLYAPIFVLIANSFNKSKSRTVWTGFTLDWYRKLFNNDVILKSLLNTLDRRGDSVDHLDDPRHGGGYRHLQHEEDRPAALVINVTYIPIMNSEMVTGVLADASLCRAPHADLGYMTLIFAHITFCVPYVILNVLPKLRQMNRNLYDAALDLGCSPMQAFRHVVIPEIMPGIVTGFLMSITYSIDDFVISYFTHGSTSQTLPITIYSMTRRKVSPEVNALSAIIFVMVLMVLLLMNIKDLKSSAPGREKKVKHKEAGK